MSGQINRQAAKIHAVVCCVFVVALFALPMVWGTDATAIDVGAYLAPVSAGHVFGTDLLGRDVAARFLVGGQRTLLMTSVASVVAIGTGLAVGIVASGDGWAAQAVSVGLRGWLGMPSLLVSLVMVTRLGRADWALALAVGFGQCAPFGVMVQAAIRQGRGQAYVTAARSLGATNWRVIVWHILPNARSLLASYAALTFGYCLLNLSTLGFLGLGADLALPEWGKLIAEGRQVFTSAPLLVIVPGLAIFFTVWSVNRWADVSPQNG